MLCAQLLLRLFLVLKHGCESKISLFETHVTNEADERNELCCNAVPHHALGRDRIAPLKGFNAREQKVCRRRTADRNQWLRFHLQMYQGNRKANCYRKDNEAKVKQSDQVFRVGAHQSKLHLTMPSASHTT